MQDIQQLRHEIISVVNVLPVDGLKLLAEFVAFLRAKFNLTQPKNSLDNDTVAPKTSGSPFLMSIAGIGQSAETDSWAEFLDNIDQYAVDASPVDLSINHEHYLYGGPKRA